MTDKIVERINAETIEELQEKQTSAQVKAASREVLLTLVAIKILQDHFQTNIALWRLVEKKARKFCMKELGVDDAGLKALLAEVNACFHKNPATYGCPELLGE